MFGDQQRAGRGRADTRQAARLLARFRAIWASISGGGVAGFLRHRAGAIVAANVRSESHLLARPVPATPRRTRAGVPR
jgi:hypothetical protein